MLSINQLRYSYTQHAPRWVLDDVNVEITSGEYVLLCGASGSGKSTLCRTFNGLIPHFHGGVMRGSVYVDGLDTRSHPVSELFAHVGAVFQNPEAQLFNSTVERELAFGLESLGLERAEIHRRVRDSAATTGIDDLLSRRPAELSGGEQHLVIIAAALALHPQLMILDEPFANLDPANVARVRAALRAINRRGTAIVLTEHRLQHVVADVDRIVVLHQGRVALDGPPRAVLREDVTLFKLNLPPVVRIARECGLSATPLSVADLLPLLDSSACLPATPPQSGSTPAGEPVLRFEHVSFAFGEQSILHQVHFDVRSGECLAIVGANGAGKTTLIKHMNGLHHPTQGRVMVIGTDTRHARVSDLARHVGLAQQNANDQFFTLQVWDEISVGARVLGRYDETWLHEVMDLFRLEPLRERAPYRLSEGEKKRVAFAAALAARPAIVVLDEPTAGQDWAFRQALGDLLGELRARGQTVVLVTHDLEFAEQHAQRWLLLAAGEIIAAGSPWEVMADTNAMQRARLEPTQGFQIRAALECRLPSLYHEAREEYEL